MSKFTISKKNVNCPKVQQRRVPWDNANKVDKNDSRDKKIKFSSKNCQYFLTAS